MLEKLTFLSAAENRETFFRRIARLFTPRDPRYKAVERAYDCAKDAFRGKERDDGDRYFEHLRATALILIDHLRIKDYRLIIAALLHDIVEDIPFWPIERVALEFDERVALLVELLTKPPLREFNGDENARDIAYHERFRFAPRDFFLIKLSDRLHNLITMHARTPEKIQHKIQETKIFYLPHAERELILLHELEGALSQLESGKKPTEGV